MMKVNVNFILKKSFSTWRSNLFYSKNEGDYVLNNEKKNEDSPRPKKKDYQGPLYAPHPDLQNDKRKTDLDNNRSR